MPKISNDWLAAVGGEFEKPYYKRLRAFLKQEYGTRTVYPGMDDIFNAFHFTPLASVKVVLLGQDPYHEAHQAIGACFAVPPDQRELPPSLVNIYKELHDDLGCPIPSHGYLKKWADEGVLLLNTVLTVRAHLANSHKGMGWEQFTDAVIQAVNGVDRPVVFFLWGRNAQAKRPMLDNPRHLILEAPHPSPLSAHRGFFGCRHFSRANVFLRASGVAPIDWAIEEPAEAVAPAGLPLAQGQTDGGFTKPENVT
jgi:uracil-DNA glycosylase